MTRRSVREKLFYYTMPKLYSKKIDELELCEEKVAWLLRNYPNTRNSDKLLAFYYWQMVDSYDGQLDDKMITGLTALESITRARRFIQSESDGLGLFPPTDPDVIRARKISQRAVLDWVRTCKEKAYLARGEI